MADRYWVGGNASWDTTAGTKWSATSGGAGGASVPTFNDNVYFNAASGSASVSITAFAFANNLDFTGFTGTLSGSSNIGLYGSITASASMNWTHTGVLQFNSGNNKTITSAGKTFGSVTVNPNSGVIVSLNDALTLSGTLTVTTGTFETNNYNITANTFISSTTGVRNINLGSSTVTLTGNSPINFSTNNNLNFNAGTSNFVFTSTLVTILTAASTNATGVTFNNISYTGKGIFTFTQGVNTINNFSIEGPVSVGASVSIGFPSRVIINGLLSTSNTAGNRRIRFLSAVDGLQITLKLNGSANISDCDFRDILIEGEIGVLSGTRLGNLGGCNNITFSTPKTVYWVTAAGGSWSNTNWAISSGGTPSNDYFPLPQDTAIIENTGLNNGATVVLESTSFYVGTLDTTSRTVGFSLSIRTNISVYGSWLNGSGIAMPFYTTTALIFAGRSTQYLLTANKSWNSTIRVDSQTGTLKLSDALTLSSLNLEIYSGTFDTDGYSLSCQGIRANTGTRNRELYLRSSTVLFTNGFSDFLNISSIRTFKLDAGTSNITVTGTYKNHSVDYADENLVFYNVTYPSQSYVVVATYNNLTLLRTDSQLGEIIFGTQNVQRTLIVNDTLDFSAPLNELTLLRIQTNKDLLSTNPIRVKINATNVSNLNNIEFSGIEVSNTTWSGTRLSNGGNNLNIVFTTPKTVYYIGNSNVWFGTNIWASSSGGSPSNSNTPLAQDTVIFDNNSNPTSSITLPSNYIMPKLDTSARTSSLTFSISSFSTVYFSNDVTLSSSVTISSGSSSKCSTIPIIDELIFSQNGATINSNFDIKSNVKLGSNFSIGSAYTLTHITGVFDAYNYNVTLGFFNSNGSVVRTLKMGEGTWELTGTSTVWSISRSSLTFFKNNANILLSSGGTSSRTFAGADLSYNKLTLGGVGISSTTITGNNYFTELASTKTTAHTINLSGPTTFGKWSVTGSAGNVVTISGTGSHRLAGSCTEDINYLSMSSISFQSDSTAEFYAGPNTTGSAGAPVYRTAKPTPSTRYWVGGTGNWSDTSKWSTSSGGAGGASVPRSHDNVIFDSASSASSYTVTVNTVTGGARCNELTITGPASGSITFTGSNSLYIHGNISLPSTGLIWTFTGGLILSGSTTGKTLTTNGISLTTFLRVNGEGCEWSLGSALTSSSNLVIQTGLFNTNSFNMTLSQISSGLSGPSVTHNNKRSLSLGSSTITLSDSIPITFSSSENFTFNSGSSEINFTFTGPTFFGGDLTFYNVSFTSTSITGISIYNRNTFNNLSISAFTQNGIKPVYLHENQTILGTLSFGTRTTANRRFYLSSGTVNTERIINVNNFTGDDIDFQDIKITGNAAPISGARFGDSKGNSNIIFDSPKTVYYVGPSYLNSWYNTCWSNTENGVANDIYTPLAQDTVIFTANMPPNGSTFTIGFAVIGTLDTSARTSNSLTLFFGSNGPLVIGNWINGTGVTISATSAPFYFRGRGVQYLTSAGKTFPVGLEINGTNTELILQDSFQSSSSSSSALDIKSGIFDANNYNVTVAGVYSSYSVNTTVKIGSGNWTLSSTTPWTAGSSTVITGSGTINLTSNSAKTFNGGSISYSGITLNQGGSGTLTMGGSNIFKNITSTVSAAISLGTTIQKLTSKLTLSGSKNNELTLSGSSSSATGYLIYTGNESIAAEVKYLRLSNILAYPSSVSWNAVNTINDNSLNWSFSTELPPPPVGNFLMFYT